MNFQTQLNPHTQFDKVYFTATEKGIRVEFANLLSMQTQNRYKGKEWQVNPNIVKWSIYPK